MRKGTTIVAAAVVLQLASAAPSVGTLVPGQVALAGCDEGPKDCNPPDSTPKSNDSTDSSASSGSSSGGPAIDIDVTDDRPRQDEEFTIRLKASDADGIDILYWWATSTDDDDLQDTHVRECQGATPCSKGWRVSTNDSGTIVLHAQARDQNGALSDEVTREIKVRHD